MTVGQSLCVLTISLAQLCDFPTIQRLDQGETLILYQVFVRNDAQACIKVLLNDVSLYDFQTRKNVIILIVTRLVYMYMQLYNECGQSERRLNMSWEPKLTRHAVLSRFYPSFWKYNNTVQYCVKVKVSQQCMTVPDLDNDELKKLLTYYW